MITGLLFTLAQKPPVPANDTPSNDTPSNDTLGEGRHFPPTPAKPAKAPYKVVRLTQIVSVILTALGLGLLSFSVMNWTFDPVHAPSLHTAVFNIIRHVGVFS